MRAAGYLRVSSVDQTEGYSLAAQERAIEEICRARGFILVRVYRDEGISAHSDRVDKRPGLLELLDDAAAGAFDVVVVHTFDRWARNLSVGLQTLNALSRARVGFISITENIDYATGQGRLNLHILGAFAEFFSDNLAGHVRKARRERFELGLHNGLPPFGYAPCGCPDRGTKAHALGCAGVVVVPEEAATLGQVADRYAAGAITLAQAAGELNQRGFRTRQGKAFTSASVRFLFGNPYLVGRVRHRDHASGRWHERPGKQPAILTGALFDRLQDRKEQRELVNRPGRRTYLLKGLAACVHCGALIWCETHVNGHTYYREQRGTRQDQGCPANGTSSRCDAIDPQVGDVFGALVLPAAWRQEIERRLADYDRVRTVEQERATLTERLRRLTTAYTLGNIEDADYQQRQAELKRTLAQLRLPELEEAVSAGELLADLRVLWQQASLPERHDLLRGMVARVYVDLTTDRLVGITPKPAFWSLFEQVRIDHPRLLLLKPDDVKRRLAEQRAAVVLVETGENRTPRPERVRPKYPTRVGDALGLAGRTAIASVPFGSATWSFARPRWHEARGTPT